MEFNKAYNRAEFLSFLKVNFLPEDFIQEESIVDNPVQFQYTQQVTRLGECDSLGLVVYEVRHSSKHDARVGLTKEAFRLLADEFCECALVFFVPQDDDSNYRFSLIEITLDQADNSAKVTRGYSNPHRYSYYLGKGIACHTPNKYLKKGRVQNVDDLRNRFSVEVLSDEFYEEYDKLYSSAPYQNCEPGFIEEFEANPEMLEPFLDKSQEDLEKQKKPMRDYVKKLMGRLVFMQFLQKKGWLGVPAECEGWKDGNEHFLQDVFKTSNHQETFLDDVLEPIFFEYLNTPYELRKRKYFSIGGREYKIPYLNGGLFEQTELDRKPSKFSVRLFQRLFDLFDLYNFTIDENDPDDVQVSVDPEMLGRIFENQLEDNNDKGAFYTPKFIVQYMCRESLVAYLQTNVEDDFEKECIRYFVEAHDKDILTPYQQKDILAKLKSVTICDPAIGSGAFPVGLLKELFYCRQELEPVASAADTKKQIIQENIYGVDIEQGAVDIARLRFWLSLIVDEETPQALPNLDYKIVEGNSLITTFDGQYINLSTNDSDFRRSSLFKIRPEKKALLAEQKRFFTLSGEEKYRSEIAIKNHILNIIGHQLYYEKISWEKATIEETGLFGIKEPKGRKKNRAQVVEFTQERQEILNKCEALIQQLNDENKTLQETANISISFFEWETIFSDIFDNEDRKGFDIVIGNPPYIKEATDKKAFEGLKGNCYYQGKMDIWYLFACFGIDLLKPNGILCFIATNNWTTNDGASKLRNKVISDTRIIQLIDFYDAMIFDSASIQTMIMLLQKNGIQNNYSFDYRKILQKKSNKKTAINLLDKSTDGDNLYITPCVNREKLKGKLLTFSSDEANDILQKMESTHCFYLNDDEIYSGIDVLQDRVNKKAKQKLNNNKNIGDGIFVLNNKECDSLNLTSKEKEIIKPYYTASLINRYSVNPKNEEWIIYAESNFNDVISLYPNIKTHLDQFKDVMTSVNKPYGLHRSRKKDIFIGEKILALRKCVDRPSFSYVNFDSFVSRAFLIIKTNRINYKFLLGLLDSTLIMYWLSHKGKMQGSHFQIDKEPILGIPLPSIDYLQQKTIITLVDKILVAKEVNLHADTESFETKIDILVYQLYNLTYDEILIVDPETPITREEYENHK